jgi:hypothetical protein
LNYTFIPVQDLFDLTPRAKSGSKKPDINPRIVETLLKFQADYIIGIAKLRGYLDKTLPLAKQKITQNQRYIYELLNLESPLAEFTIARSPETEKHIFDIANLQRQCALKNFKRFLEDELYKAWVLELPASCIATDEELICFVYQFQRYEPDETTIPNITTVRKLGLRYSAFIYAIASKAGYDVFNLDEHQRSTLAGIVGRYTSAAILRVKTELDNSQVDNQANEVLKLADEKLDDLVEHRNDYSY